MHTTDMIASPHLKNGVYDRIILTSDFGTGRHDKTPAEKNADNRCIPGCIITPEPTIQPTIAPSKVFTKMTLHPTAPLNPTITPTVKLSSVPSNKTAHPTMRLFPTMAPDKSAPQKPSSQPYTSGPTIVPTAAKRSLPTASPTQRIIKIHTTSPTNAPSAVGKHAPTESPTKPITHAPSAVGKHAPTESPTKPITHAPSAVGKHDPTESPTKPITHAPSVIQTILPTSSSVLHSHSPVIPSMAPTTIRPVVANDSVTRTNAPTPMPSKNKDPLLTSFTPSQGFSYPTASPSSGFVTTYFPTVLTNPRDTCKTNDYGSYGTITGQMHSIAVRYLYQIEASPMTPVRLITSNIIPPLEKQIVDQLIPTLFALSCGSRSLRHRQAIDTESNLSQQKMKDSHTILVAKRRIRGYYMTEYSTHRILSELSGISANPPDVVKGSCLSTLQKENECVAVDGRVTIFSDAILTGDVVLTLENTISTAICDNMLDGSLLNAHPLILRLSCFNSTGSNVVVPDPSDKAPIEQNVNQRIPAYNFIIGAAALGIVLVAVFVYLRRKTSQKKSLKQEEHSSHEENYLDDSDAETMQGDVRDVAAHNFLLEANRDSFDDIYSDPYASPGVFTVPSPNSLVSFATTSQLILEDIKEHERVELDEAYSDIDVLDSDADAIKAKSDEHATCAYDFGPVLSKLSSPGGIATFAKSSYFSEEEYDVSTVVANNRTLPEDQSCLLSDM